MCEGGTNAATAPRICSEGLRGRLVTRQTDPLGYAVRHEHDASGNRTRTIDAKNQATTFAYDSRDRLTQITDPLNGQTRYGQYPGVTPVSWRVPR